MNYRTLSVGSVCWLVAGLSAHPAELPDAQPQQIAFPDSRLAVHGLPWFAEDQPELRRLPSRLKERFRPPVWGLAQSPSGGRIRFRTPGIRRWGSWTACTAIRSGFTSTR